MFGMSPLVGENLTKKGGCLGMRNDLSEIYTQVQSRCVLVVMLYGTDRPMCRIWEGVRCWGGYAVFVYKMFGLLESTMDKTRQSPYLLTLLLVSPGGCPLFEWNCAVRCLRCCEDPRMSCVFLSVLMSWFPLWALSVLFRLCRVHRVFCFLGVLVPHTLFLKGFVSLHATRSLWAVFCS